MNLKVNQNEETIARIISRSIKQNVADKNLKEITITGAKLSNDMSHARVFYSMLNRKNQPKVEAALAKANGFFRSEVASALNAKHAPELRFVFDTSIDRGERVEEILRSLNK